MDAACTAICIAAVSVTFSYTTWAAFGCTTVVALGCTVSTNWIAVIFSHGNFVVAQKLGLSCVSVLYALGRAIVCWHKVCFVPVVLIEQLLIVCCQVLSNQTLV